MTQKPENLPTHDVAGRFAAPIDQTAHEPAHWEKEADAIRLLLADKKRQIFTTDESRRVQEALDADTYWKLPYYERWIHGFSSLLKEKGVLQEADLITDTAHLYWNAEWKENRQAWNERSLYVDAAWFVGQNQVLSLLRYSQGRSFKLPGSRAQTLSPYAFVQGTQQNALADLRLGLGLRWQWWLDQDQHRAYRRKLTGRAELQQSLAGDLYSRSTGVVLSLQADL